MDLRDVAVAVDPSQLISDPLADRERLVVCRECCGEPAATALGPPDVVMHVRFAQHVAKTHICPEAPLLVCERLAKLAFVPVDRAQLLERFGYRVAVVDALS